MKNYRLIILAFIVLVLSGMFANFFLAIGRIYAGCVGIKVNLVGGVDDITEVTGWVPYMPLFT